MLYSREAEEALIGSVLINPNVMSETDIMPSAFFLERHKWIWEEARKLDVVDVLTLTEALGDRVDAAYFGKLINNTPSSMNAKQYAAVINDYARRRADMSIAEDLAREATDGEVQRASIIDRLLENESTQGEAIHISETLRELVELVHERSKDPKDIWGIPTGFPDVDKVLGGLQRKQTLYLAAPPGVGKSVLAVQIAKQVAEKGHGVAIYSFEMEALRLLTRMVSAESGVPTRAMATGRMEDHWEGFNNAVEAIEHLPIWISDIYGMTSTELSADISRLQARQDFDLVVIDYLNKLLDRDGGDDLANTKLKAQRIQGLCKKYNLAGIVVQSMNKSGMEGTPKLSAMSGPSDVAHEGDNVFLLASDTEDKSILRLLTAKMRDSDQDAAFVSLRWLPGLPKLGSVAHENPQ